MTVEELTNLVLQLQRQLSDLQQLVRRHKHDDIETDKLPFSSFKDWGANKEHWVLTSRGATLPPTWDLTGISVSSSPSPSLSPSSSVSSSSSASRSPSASLSPSASPSP